MRISGFASFGEYVERLFGLGRRAIEEKLRVATALEVLPELEQALRSGNLNWSAVREVTRVAVPQTEREWIAEVRGKTVREVERLVSGLAPGDRPKDPRRAERVRYVLRFEVGAETLATFREAMRLLQKRRRSSVDGCSRSPRRRHGLRLHAVIDFDRGQRQGLRGAQESGILGKDSPYGARLGLEGAATDVTADSLLRSASAHASGR